MLSEKQQTKSLLSNNLSMEKLQKKSLEWYGKGDGVEVEVDFYELLALFEYGH